MLSDVAFVCEQTRRHKTSIRASEYLRMNVWSEFAASYLNANTRCRRVLTWRVDGDHGFSHRRKIEHTGQRRFSNNGRYGVQGLNRRRAESQDRPWLTTSTSRKLAPLSGCLFFPTLGRAALSRDGLRLGQIRMHTSLIDTYPYQQQPHESPRGATDNRLLVESIFEALLPLVLDLLSPMLILDG